MLSPARYVSLLGMDVETLARNARGAGQTNNVVRMVSGNPSSAVFDRMKKVALFGTNSALWAATAIRRLCK